MDNVRSTGINADVVHLFHGKDHWHKTIGCAYVGTLVIPWLQIGVKRLAIPVVSIFRARLSLMRGTLQRPALITATT
jgi:hypothetical protein